MNQFDRKVNIASRIEAGLQMYDQCVTDAKHSKEIATTSPDQSGVGLYEADCSKYSTQVRSNLLLSTVYFQLGASIKEKINRILTQKDDLALNPSSIALSHQVYEVLTQELMQEKKQLGLGEN